MCADQRAEGRRFGRFESGHSGAGRAARPEGRVRIESRGLCVRKQSGARLRVRIRVECTVLRVNVQLVPGRVPYRM